MKISSTARWLLVIGIFAILLIALGVNWVRQQAQQAALDVLLANAKQEYLQNSAEKKELDARLGQTSSHLRSVQDEFRRYTESIEMNEALFRAAEQSGVTILEITASVPGQQSVAGQEGDGKKEADTSGAFQTFPITVTAQAPAREMVSLINFAKKVTEEFPGVYVELVDIAVPDEPEEGVDAEQEDEELPSITLSLRIYVYPAS